MSWVNFQPTLIDASLDYFLLLLGVELFHLIAEETNRYAQFKGAINFAVTPAEIAAFISINIAMGIVNMPTQPN